MNLAELGVVHLGVIVTNRPRGEHAEAVEVVLAGTGVVKVHSPGLVLNATGTSEPQLLAGKALENAYRCQQIRGT